MRFIPAWQIAVDHEWNARKLYDRIDLLAKELEDPESQRVPFEVRPIGPPFERHAEPDRYFLLAGHRRWLALEKNLGEKLQKREVPVIVLRPGSEAEARIINLRENTQHRAMRNCDLARAFAQLGKLGMPDEVIAAACAMPTSLVTKLRVTWNGLIQENREFWATDSSIKEPSLPILFNLSQKDRDHQERWRRRQLGVPIPEEATRQIVRKDREKSPWIRPKFVDVKKLVRDFRLAEKRQRRGLDAYEMAYLDAILWVTGQIGMAYNPFTKKGPRNS